MRGVAAPPTLGGMDDAHLRASDADRAAVRQLLEHAVGEGMLTLDEFTERLDTTLAARTRGDLDAVLADLPTARRRPGAGVPAGEPLLLRARMSSLTRRGEWTVPPRLRLDTRLCDTTLDFTSAQVQGPVVELDIDDYCSVTTLVLPDGATADLNALATVGSSATVRVRTAPPSERLHLVVRGRVRLGTVTARHSFGASWRRFTGELTR